MKDVRKTSGRYKLVFTDENYEDILLIGCNPYSGVILPNNGGEVVGLDLSVLDQCILKCFKTSEELKRYLVTLGYNIPQNYEGKIMYKSSGRTCYLDLIYGNKLLYEFATLFRIYKEKYSQYQNRRKIKDGFDLRKTIIKEIQKEKIWRQFFKTMLIRLHDSDFRNYLFQNFLLGKRVLYFIQDYLDNSGQETRVQKEAYSSALYYLRETFATYKPLRGMIMSVEEYKKRNIIQTSCAQLTMSSQLPRIQSSVEWYRRTMRPLSLAEVAYLEKHDVFDTLSDDEKIAFANNIIAREKQYQKH